MADEGTNLPLVLSSLVGRIEEIRELDPLVRQARLVTLAGTGGIGKTRLALEVARRVTPHFADGVRLVELAPLGEAALVSKAVAAACGIPDSMGGSLADTIAEHLKARDLLLVLDNCEHLVIACADLVEHLLGRCEHLHVLATSREPLGISGEMVWRVPSLSLPLAGADFSDARSLQHSDAARLFAERARAVSPKFSLQATNASAVAQICRRLDGIPLALELAAARTAVLTPSEIAERLDNRFNLLSKNGRGAPSRHQTLSAVINWSYALLSPEEAAVVARLSVFAGGCNLSGAEAVCSDTNVDSREMLEILARLVDKSLVMTTASEREQETRYHLLETVRQFALERLHESGEEEPVRRRHLAYFIRVAEQAGPELRRANVLAWLDRLETEHDNFREALRWALNRSKAEAEAAKQALQLASLLAVFWLMRSHLSEGGMWLREALDQELAQEPSVERARALRGAARMPGTLGDEFRSVTLLEESRHVSEALGAEGRLELARASVHAAGVLTGLGRADEARSLNKQGLDLYRELGDEAGVADALLATAEDAPELDIATARQLAAKSLETFRSEGDLWKSAWALRVLGRIALAEGDFASAEDLYQQALELNELIGFQPGISGTLFELGRVMRLRGDLDGAEARLEQALGLGRKFGWPLANEIIQLGHVALARGDIRRAAVLFGRAVRESPSRGFRHELTCGSLIGLAEALLLAGKPAEAARLVGVLDGLEEKTGLGPGLSDRLDYERHVETVRGRLDPDALARALDEGRTLDPMEAITAAVDELTAEGRTAPHPPENTPRRPPLTPREAAKVQWNGLTSRERDVAALVAQGKSNREIAQDLVVSERTVDAHLVNILGKLEFKSRTQVAAWAIGKGLGKLPRDLT